MSRLTLAGLVECSLPCVVSSQPRRIFVTKDIDDLLNGKVLANPEFPSETADREIGKFVRGYIVGVSRKHSSKAELKWMTGVPESWVYCFRQPPPGWRLFGRFAQKNVFVGLRLVTREEAGTLIEYAQNANAMIASWDGLFPKEGPFMAKDFEGYLGDMVVER